MTFGWPEVPIGHVARPVERLEAPVAGRAYRQVGVRLWGEGAYEREPMDGADTRYSTLSRVQPGDIIVNKIWARNGSVSVVTPELDGCYCSGEFPLFRPHEDKLDPEWFRWITKTNWFWKRCDEQSQGTSGKNRIRPEKFLGIPIPLPPLEEQRRIVAVIERLAGKIETARGLRRETVSGVEALLPSSSRSLMGDPTWHWSAVEKCCEALIDYRGRTPPIADEGIPHLTSANIRDGRINWDTPKFVTETTYEAYMTRGIPRQGDVLFTMEAPLGEAAVLTEDRRFSLAQRTLLLRGKADLISGAFLARALTTPMVREAIYARATGTTVKGIASKRLRAIGLPVPPLAEQRRIVANLDNLQVKIDRLKVLQAQTGADLGALLPAVLDRAFRGEL